MTPEKKAQELIDAYQFSLYNNNGNVQLGLTNEMAIQCAIIFVEQVGLSIQLDTDESIFWLDILNILQSRL
jgi:hypothetical protein